MTVVQKGTEPSMHLVLTSVLTLRRALSSFENLTKFNKENDESSKRIDDDSANDQDELESEETDGKWNCHNK